MVSVAFTTLLSKLQAKEGKIKSGK